MPPTLAAKDLPTTMPGQFRFTTKALEPFTSEDGRPRFRTIASSTIKDRGKDEMKISALEDMRNAFQRGVTFYLNHKYVLPEDLFGITDTAEIRDSGLKSKSGAPIYDLYVEGWVAESNPRAVQLHKAMAPRKDGGDGVNVGTSVGAVVEDHKRNKDGGLDIEHVDLIEGSMVGIPMNQRSWVQKAAKAARELDERGDDTEEESEESDVPQVVADEADATEETTEVEKAAGDPEITTDIPLADADESATIAATTETTDGQEAGPAEDGQDADESDEPETASTSEGETPATPETASTSDEETEEVQKALSTAYESGDVVDLVKHVTELVDLIRKQGDEIVTLKAQVALIEGERDEATAAAATAAGVIAKMAKMPLRRKAAAIANDVTTRYPDFLAPEVVQMLKAHQGEETNP